MSLVVIAQRRLTHYRAPLFIALRNLLSEEGIALRLVVGDATAREQSKKDDAELEWSVRVRSHYLGPICWQAFGQHIDGADLVIVTHENKLLYNHWLLFRPRR